MVVEQVPNRPPTELEDGPREGHIWVISKSGPLAKCKYEFGKYFCPNCDQWYEGNPKVILYEFATRVECGTCNRMLDLI